ncbi:unnamed protein product [Rotaria socialis]|uniref:Structural maintenance of chromosomes protein n=1 Tax=Rotaria socialis TaxID=392032 RepID=A0A818XDB0_9BILA|nr:unnamed protein product [Rotaria socialis]CAF3496080.1 unnamed protein product [Rotaria socialis]CAF3630747.1 unnamed protein product [Rotaria socialis]CAF3738022.1 unnamed protein product [Rotaria socialis]
MFIKQVIIQGFRSYRDETIIEPFSQRYNIIVGRNGCGKSNFFFAIQFVLSDEFSNLSAEGRYNLMHEGINSRALNAYVEIIFDNSDSRIMIDKPEIAVRRQISGKKDNYFLDRKVVNKTDIINMLEGAGFSRSNPYYIVKQGKITQMAIAPDANRLQLLREVAGTKVYDEKKQESEAILAETEERRKKIADLLKAIEERLLSLETEKEELKQYQKWDRSKRGLECAICMAECEEAKKRIDEIVAKMNGATQKIEQLESDRLSVTELVQQNMDSITELKQRLQTQQIERETLIVDNKDNFQRKAQIELELQDLQGETEQRDVKRDDLKRELAKYDKLLTESEQQLAKILPNYDLLRREEEQKTAQRDLAEEKRKELFAKRGRGNQFGSKEDRDKWIRLELKSLNKAIHDKREQMQRLKKELEDETIKSREIEEQLRQIADNGNEQRSHMDNVSTRVRDLRQKKSDIAGQKTDLARKETQLHMQLSQTRDELRKSQDSLRSIMNKGAASGADGIQRLLRQYTDENRNLDIVKAYHGTLIENIECDPAFYTAVEVIAGNRLNYHIVDNDVVATRLVKEFNNARQRGEIHFLPLNVLEVHNNTMSHINGASPLIDQLQWVPKVEKAVRHVFNRIMLCEDFNSATRTARQYDVDCVTLDGDQVQRKGALTGGYIDKRISRLELQGAIKQLRSTLTKYEEEYDKLRQEITHIDNEHNNIMTELQREDMKSKKNWDNYEQMKSDSKHLQSELDRIITHRPTKERQLNTLHATIEQFCAKEESLQSELGSDLISQLTVEEQATIDRLNNTIEYITQELKEIIRKRVELEGTKTRLEHQISNNYRKNRDRISTDLERLHVENVRSVIEELEREYTILSDKLNEHEKQTDAIDRIINNLDRELKAKQKELEQLKNSDKDIDERINEEKRNTDKYEVKLRNAQNKLDESTKRQNDIGVPPDGLEKYKEIPTKQLQRDLDRAVVELKKYAHVNKKALDQFLQFSDERDKLTNRKAEIDEAHRHIVDLIESLDNKRFETIQFTFKQVSLYFTEVFKRLVPEGTAHLVIKKGDNEDYDSEQVSSQSSGQQMSVDDFTGVGIKVSFNGRANEMRDMQQLSGGQKSLVALALIFAIQKCDPAPFYLFDEIDQALDPQYRHAVADMINELSQKAQFIITTFGPDLLKYGDKFYGITYRNKVSQIRSVTRDEALEFVEDNDAQNQVAQAAVATTAVQN